MTDSDSTLTADLLSLQESDLLARLGADLAGPQALPLTVAELSERGTRWLKAQQAVLEAHVCSSESIREFAVGTSDNSAIAVELAKLLASLLLPVNPVTLAVLLVKRGLKTFCSGRWGAA